MRRTPQIKASTTVQLPTAGVVGHTHDAPIKSKMPQPIIKSQLTSD